jgi:hypothetical protein
LHFKTDEEIQAELSNPMLDFTKKTSDFENLDSYLEAVNHQPFKDDNNIILIEPDINIKEKFDKIDLPCNTEQRINNTLNAPIRPPSAIVKEKTVTKPSPP